MEHFFEFGLLTQFYLEYKLHVNPACTTKKKMLVALFKMLEAPWSPGLYEACKDDVKGERFMFGEETSWVM